MKIMSVTTEVAEALIEQILERISDSTGLNISVKSIQQMIYECHVKVFKYESKIICY